uniref:Uncharacterized protein n=1 Tax=Leersia perrieri TaxID=77586 RepID=A0A0D9XYM6_9ORYZ
MTWSKNTGLMEDMENNFCRVFNDVCPSVVLVEQIGRIDYYCIGSVILSDDKNTFVLTQSKIADSTAKLLVRFYDGFKQSATVIFRKDNLCILMTDFYSKSKTVEFFKGLVDHSHVIAIAPASKTSVHNMPGFVTQKSLEACHSDNDNVLEGGENFFMLTMRYGDRSPNLESRLISGPVFNLDGQVVGIITGDIEYKFWPRRTNGEIIHQDIFVFYGVFFKVAMHVS